MANSPTFSLQGSTPKLQTGMQSTTPALSSTPAAKALNNASNFSSIVGGIGNAYNTVKGAASNLIGNEYKAVGNTASGIYNYLTAPSGTSYGQANPTQPFQYNGLLPAPPSNFQTASGQNTYQAPPNQSALASLGQSAPQQNGGVLPAQQGQTAAATVNNSAGTANPNANYYGSQSNGSANTQPPQPGQNNPVTYPGLIQQQAQFDPFSNPTVAGAYKSAQDINAELAQSKLNEASGEKTLLSQAIPLGDSQGQAQVYRNQALAQQNALSSELQGQTNIYNAGFTGTGQQLSGLNAAAGNAAPQLGATGQQAYYNPLTQQQAPGGNTAFGAGQVQGNVALGQQYAQNVSAFNQGQAVKTNIVNYLNSNPSLNPSDFTDVNKALQFLNGKVSNPQYQVLANYLQEYVNTLAPILGVGGDTTNLKTEIANGFVNAHQSGQSIAQVLGGIEQLAQAKLNAQQGGSQGGVSSIPTGSSLYSF